jgi:hypothetical protein
VKATQTKNKKVAVIPLKAETTALLKARSANKLPTAALFNVPKKTAKMLHADMKVARQQWLNEVKHDPKEYERRQKDGFLKAETYVGVADFHSLRHTAGTLLAASGAHPKVAQSIMRHSDINLTMGLYTHTLRGQESQAIENLPDLPLTGISQSHKATGTDDRPVDACNSAYKILTKKSDFDRNSLSSIGNTGSPEAGSKAEIHKICKPLETGKLGTKKGRLSLSDTGLESTERCRARTCDMLIKSQLLYQLS